TDRVPTGVSTVARTSLKGSMPASFRRAAGEAGDELAAKYARLFMWHTNLRRDLWPGDGLAAVYNVDPQGRVIIEAARLDSQKLQQDLVAYRFQATGDAYPSDWFADGREVPERLKKSPMVHYEQITALLRDGRNHKGMDFMAPEGNEVRSPF